MVRARRILVVAAPLLVPAGMFGGLMCGENLGEFLDYYPPESAATRYALLGQTIGVWLATALNITALSWAEKPDRRWQIEHVWQAMLLYAVAALGALVFLADGAAIAGHMGGLGFYVLRNALAAALANALFLWLYSHRRRRARVGPGAPAV